MKKNYLLFLLLILINTAASAQWQYVAFEKYSVWGIGFDGDVIYANVWYKGMQISKDKGQKFEISEDGHEALANVFVKYNDGIFYNGWWLHKTADTGKTVKNIWVYTSLSTPAISTIAVKDSFFFVAENSVYRTTTPDTDYWPKVLPYNLAESTKHIMFFNDTLFVAQFMGRILFTRDLGNTWDSCQTRVFSKEYTSLQQIAINNNYIFAATYDDGVHRSPNRGDTWEKVGKGIINDSVTTIIAKDNFVVAGTWNGVYFSTDNGDSWYERNYGLDSTTIYKLYFNDDYVWAATSSGIYKIKLDELFTGVDDAVETEEHIFLSPNPATDYIDVMLSGAKEPVLSVKVYDVLGNVVDTPPGPLLIEGESVRIDVSGLAAGVYFVRVGGRMLKFLKL
jgi:hypothetical protein